MIKQIDDIIESSKLAAIAKEKNPKVINGVIGMLNDNDGKLFVYNSVKDCIRATSDSDYFSYSAVDGGNNYKNQTINFLFGRHQDLIKANFEISSIPTPGSTLAIFLSMSLFKKSVKRIIMPNYYWNAYDNMIDFFKFKKCKYNYLTETGFDFESFKNVITQTLETQKNIFVLFNDPANNPTGYSLSSSEWENVINLLNTFVNNKIYLILDVAYLDFKEGKYEDNRNFFLPFINMGKNTIICLCYSGSKTFASYGLRVGSLTLFSKNYKAIFKLSKECLAFARSVWSTVPSTGLNMYLQLTQSEENIHKYVSELKYARTILSERANLFLTEAKYYNLETLPYKAGFFITIKSNTPKRDHSKLIKKGIYTVLINQGIRLAISGLTIYEISGLAKRIKNAISS
jgi:aspartate/tyrosine/aromatic aminotransferase